MTDFKWPRDKHERTRLRRVKMVSVEEQPNFEVLCEWDSLRGGDYPSGTVGVFCKEYNLMYTELMPRLRERHKFVIIAPTRRGPAIFKLRFNIDPPLLKE
jgi:hypothetical protein